MASSAAVDNAVEIVTVDDVVVVVAVVVVVVDGVVLVVIFVDVLEVVVVGIFEVDISFVNVLNCVVDGLDRGVVNANVPEPPIALLAPVELLSDLIGTIVVITGLPNISSSLTLALFSVDVTTIDASFSVLFDVIGLVVDVSDVVACIEKVFDEFIEVDVVDVFVSLFAVTVFVVAGLIVEVAFAFECTQ